MQVKVIKQNALVGNITLTTYGVLVDGVPKVYFTDYEKLSYYLEGLGINEKSGVKDANKL